MLRLGKLLPDTLMTDLRRCYAEPQRHYHTWAHIEALLLLFEEVRGQLSDAAAVEAALYYHDAVYDPQAADNEAQSAALLRRDCAGVVAEESLEAAALLVEATARHDPPPDLAGAALEDARLFLDMDLSILAAPWPVFSAYEGAIRQEYAFVEEAAYRHGRRRVLKSFLQRERLYLSAHFDPRLDKPARENLRRSLSALS